MSTCSPQIIDRMEELLRRIAKGFNYAVDGRSFDLAASDIIHDLEDEREPDLVHARLIATSHGAGNLSALLDAIKLGRELAGK